MTKLYLMAETEITAPGSGTRADRPQSSVASLARRSKGAHGPAIFRRASD
jgi:hypothetical protein